MHIPFCVRKCRYCDFLSFPADEDTCEAYVRALEREIWHFEDADRYEAVSIYFGGGTPSYLRADLTASILDCLRERFTVRPDAEITIECNPGTLSGEKLKIYREAGFNRLSLGLQSADDVLLERLGRIHTYEMFREEYIRARREGFDNINVDLMYALPGLDLEGWNETLEKVLNLPNESASGSRDSGPEHISAYSLIIEEGTPFWEMYHEDAEARARGDRPLFLPCEEEEDRMLALLEKKLSERGMHRYEISNYAPDGYESVHNTGYWVRREYAGFGLGASGQLGHLRLKNTEDLSAYLTGEAPAKTQLLTRKEEIEETMFLGLRMMRGVNLEKFAETFGIRAEELYARQIKDLSRMELLEMKDGYLFLSQRGIDVSNLVLSEFLLD